MTNIKVNTKQTKILEKKVMEYAVEVEGIHNNLHAIADKKDEFVGWLHLPTDYDKDEFENIKKSAEKIRKDSDILLVIGIGGSYLGARAVIDALSHNFDSLLPEEKRKGPHIIYVGNNLNPAYVHDVMEILKDKDFSINVISKSGTTTEPAIAFRIIRE